MRRLVLIVLVGLMIFVATPISAASESIDFDGGSSHYTIQGGSIGSGFDGNGVMGAYSVYTPAYYDYFRTASVRVNNDYCPGSRITNVAAQAAYSASYTNARLYVYQYSSTDVLLGSSSNNILKETVTSVSFSYSSIAPAYLVILAQTSWNTSGAVTAASITLDNIVITYNCTPSASFVASPRQGISPHEVWFSNTSTGAETYLWDFGDGNTSTQTNPRYTYTSPGTYTVTLEASDGAQADYASQTIEVFSDTGFIGGASYKPLQSADIDEWGIFDQWRNCELDESIYHELEAIMPETWNCELDGLANPDANEFVHAFASVRNRNVHSIGSGTVTAISPIGSACTSELNGYGAAFSECYVVVPDGVINSTGSAGEQFLRLDTDTMQRVTVDYEGEFTVDYYVSDPQVSVGDEITPGCIIGKTVNLYGLVGIDPIRIITAFLPGEFTASVPISDPVDKSWTGVYASFSTPEDRLYPQLVLNPDNLTPCNVDPNFRSCSGDSQLQDPLTWTISPDVVWNPGSKPVVLPFGYLRDEFFLDNTKQYSLTVQARAINAGTASLQLRLGNTTQTFSLSQELSPYQIPAGTHTPDAGLFYTAQVGNSGSVGIQIESFCLTEGTVNSQPGSCYFLNPSFDDNLNHWSASAGVSEWVTTGQILMSDGDTISQSPPSPLYPNGASEWEYYVTLKAAVIGDGWESASTSTVGFSWEFPSGGATGNFTSPASTTTYAFSSFKVNIPNNLNTFAGNEILFQAVLPISVVTSGAFTLTANLDLNDDFVGGVLLRELCVNDPLAQWPDDGAGGGIDPPFNPSCTRISPPTTADVGAWTFFLWSSLDNFFQCDLMRVLNQLNSTANTTLHYLRWQGLYQQSIMQAWANWIPSNVIPWLNGHFRNMAVGSVTVVNQESGGCHDLFCLADSFFNGTFGLLGPLVDLFVNIVTQGAQLLFTLIVALVTIFIALIGQVWSLFSALGQYLGGFVNAWNNAAPVTPDYLPSCAVDYTSSAFCVAMFALENTIFSGPGVFLIPLVIGFGSINLLLWALGKVRDIISDVGRAV